VTTALSSDNVLPAVSAALARLAAAAAPSIVQVHGRSHRPASGIVVGPNRVLTTSHSVEWEEGVTVRTLDGTVRTAEVAGHDDTADLVLLRVDGLDAPPLRYASEPAQAGHLVLVAGRTWRGTAQVRVTAITSLAGPLPSSGGGRLDQVLGLGVGVYAGFSGSAVIGADGAVVGIATAGIMRGGSLAIPASIAERIAGDLDKHGGRRRGYLGISTHPVRLPDHQRGTAHGDRALLIVDVGQDTPAAKAGLMVGDVLVRFDGAAIGSADALLDSLGPDRIGHESQVTVLRGAAPTDVRVKIEARPSRSR
jgi:S1-C subfamily serine protease